MKISLLRFNKNLILPLLLAYSLDINAAAILLIDDRTVEGNAFIGGVVGGGSSSATGQNGVAFELYQGGEGVFFDAFDDSIPAGVEALGGAGQTSTVSTTSFIGSLNASASISDPNDLLDSSDAANGETFYNISFELLTAHAYTLDGSLSIDPNGPFGQVSTLSLGDISLSELDSTFALSGILQAGTYQLAVAAEVFASPNESGRATVDFDLQLSEVPVPAAAWLFASGILGFIAVARKKTRV